MEFQVSARKYRPTNFKEVLGQPHVVQTLTNAIDRKRVAHAYVFSGMRGVGKTTVARILAKSLNCEQGPTSHACGTCPSCVEITRGNSVDVIEIDGASNTGVDDVRELRENVKFAPFHGTYRVYIIDEVHMLSNSAFNALLKTLEEPPSHCVFIFATTEVHKIPATILSRCQHFTFRRISRLEIITQLRHVATQTSVTVEDRSLSALARASEGSMRDALSLLDQAVSFGGERIQHGDLEMLIGSVPDELVRLMIDAILGHQAAQTMSLVGQLVDQGFDVRVYCRELLERCRNLLVACVVPSRPQVQTLLELGDEEVDQAIAQAQQLSEPYLQALFAIFSRTEDGLRGSSHPRFLIEAAVVRAALLDPVTVTATTTEQKASAPAQSISHAKPLSPATSTPPPAQPAKIQTPAEKPVTPPSQAPLKPSGGAATMFPSSTPPGVENPVSTKASSDNSEPSKASPNTAAQPSSGPPMTLNWELVVERMINDHPNIGSFLEKGSVVSMTAGSIVLGYSKKDSIARWRTDKPENRVLIGQICEEFAGCPVKVQVIEFQDGQAYPPSTGELRAKKKLEQDQDLIENVKAHPLVKQALELFGGEVVSAERTPQNEEVR
ncbi:DNA polymerase III subunit gamma/tau [uncultured Nitrospira sp.]|uniref:DNA polymerase III subunit gamma/tau n=1 Tax=uncultured Nitrospira sp. TaxID=157176 RepID=UPI003140264E